MQLFRQLSNQYSVKYISYKINHRYSISQLIQISNNKQQFIYNLYISMIANQLPLDSLSFPQQQPQQQSLLTARQFIAGLQQISTQITNYYLEYPHPSHPYKKKKHLVNYYTFVYHHCCCVKPQCQDKMYDIFKSAMQKHINKQIDMFQHSTKNGKLIEVYNTVWKIYSSFAQLLSKRFFPTLDRYYLPNNDYQKLYRTALSIFRTHQITQRNIKHLLICYQQALQKFRFTKIINHSQLYLFTQSIKQLDIKKLFPIFKVPILITQDCYFNKANQHYQSVFQTYCNDLPLSYMNNIINLTYFQNLLAQQCITRSPYQLCQLFQLLQQKLIKNYTKTFCLHPSGFSYCLRSKNISYIKLINQFYRSHVTDLKNNLYQFIIQQGTKSFNLIQQSNSQNTSQYLINNIYNFYISYHQLIFEGFNKNVDLYASFKSAFQQVLLQHQQISQDLFKCVRNYLDHDKFDAQSKKMLKLIQKLPDKDYFINLYKNSLQQKIINKNIIYLIQKKFIQSLKKICGSSNIDDLNNMLQDYIEFSQKKISLQTDQFQLIVVSFELWKKKYENELQVNYNLIQPLSTIWFTHQLSYTQQFPKRKLILLPYQTKIKLKIINNHKQLQITCNLIQASIILYITNNADNPTKLKQQSLINGLYLKKAYLQTFAQQFSQFISYNSTTSSYTFNWNFKFDESTLDFHKKIQQQKKTIKQITPDRQALIQCSIMRIMKKNKQMNLDLLINKTIQIIKIFKLDPDVVKDQIEILKKKLYIQENNQLVTYLN